MTRDLTVEEAGLVAQQARPSGQRPQIYTAATDSTAEISTDFETYLILTPISLRNQIAQYFQTIIDNDPNDLQTYSDLLTEFLEEELRNDTELMRAYNDYTSLYDQVRDAYSSSTDGFTDVDEVGELQVALTNSLGQLAEQRDRYSFNYAVLNVLRDRNNNSGRTGFVRELQSWIRALVTYE